MAKVSIQAEAPVGAPAERVYGVIADYRQHHPRILPPAFTGLTVEQGGVGAGTVIRFGLKAFGRVQESRAKVDEPEPGRVLRESEIGGKGIITTFTVLPESNGSRVRIQTEWETGGLAGIVERLLAPRMLKKLYAEELGRLDRYARGEAV